MVKKLAIILVCLSVLFLAACDGGEGGGGKGTNVPTFAEYTDVEMFRNVPAFSDMSRLTIKDAGDYGDGNYVLVLSGTFKDQYDAYLQILESAGFTKILDNGETGVGDIVYAAYFEKDDLKLNVSLAGASATTYISVTKAAEISPYLTYDASYGEGLIDGAKTTLYMHQVPEYGNCFVIQLKNGHFLVNDGGNPGDLENLLKWLEETAPAGQKPVIEAWFISHEHPDHSGVFTDIPKSVGIADRIAVEGVYYSQVNQEVANLCNAAQSVGKTYVNRSYLKNSAGEMTPIYRPHLGDRYYFCDITVEVPFTQEQMRVAEYSGNLNASSTWLMYNIEGQKFLLCGDTEEVNMKRVDEIYNPAYMDVDIMNNHHHALNLYTANLGYFKAETLLYSTWGVYSIYWPKETLEYNLTLQREYCEEYMSYLEGGKKLTFPYTIGSAENLEPWYPEATERLMARQEGWMADAGITYPIK